MIDPPSQPPGHAERRAELDHIADYAVQLLVEEAHLVGWQRLEFLNGLADAVNARLATVAEESAVEDGALPPADIDDADEF